MQDLTAQQHAGFACVRCGFDYLNESRALVAGAEGVPTPTQPVSGSDYTVACAPACAVVTTSRSS